MKNRDNHNILMLIMKNGTRSTYSFPFSTQKEDALIEIGSAGDVNLEDVDKVLFFNETDANLSMFGDYFNIEKSEVGLIQNAVAEKLVQVRSSRRIIMQKLDLEMLKLLEEEEICEECRKHFTAIKKYLRDLPTLMMNHSFKNPNQVYAFNPYDNVFDLYIENAGSGYSIAPEIEIEPPNLHPLRKGFPLKAEVTVENGSLKTVTVTQIGSSYISRPKITVPPPDQEGGEQAILMATLPENNVNLPPLIIE